MDTVKTETPSPSSSSHSTYGYVSTVSSGKVLLSPQGILQSFLGVLGSPHDPLATPTEKCAGCFVHGKDTLQITHTFLLGGLSTCPGSASFGGHSWSRLFGSNDTCRGSGSGSHRGRVCLQRTSGNVKPL